MTSTLTRAQSITQHDGYTLAEAGEIQLGKTTFRVQLQHLESNGETITWLYGPRGAAYTLEPLSMFDDSGVRRVISWKSGAPLRVRGNEVRVIVLGNLIEVAA